MKTQRYKIFGCLLLIGAVVVSFCVALSDANADFGETITTAQMANMFGGGWVWCGDTDCDTTSGSCPGGSTCDPDDDSGTLCQTCQSGNGDKCGAPGGMGWQCVDSTKSCAGVKGYCVKVAGSNATCEKRASDQTPPTCGTRPDC